MKVKVSELTGAALDYAVAVAEGYFATFKPEEVVYAHPDGRWHHNDNWRPATNWSQGGPIIEREHISVTIGDWDKEIEPVVASWAARNLADEMEGNSAWAYGPTPLIAAMRCYVASKLGDEVEIPEALR